MLPMSPGEVRNVAREFKSIDVSNAPKLLRLAEEARASQEPRVLRRDGEDLAVVRPIKPRRRRIPRGGPFARNDPPWNLAGADASGHADVSEHKHKYLAESSADLHEHD